MKIKSAETPNIEICNLITCIGDTIDISAQMLQITIFEDMFSPCLQGNITIVDNLNLFDNLPINGEEKLTLKFSSWNYDDQIPLNHIHRTFDVLEVVNIKSDKDHIKTYTLKFASPEFKINESILISRGFEDIRYSEIMAQIMTNDIVGEISSENMGLGFPTNDSYKSSTLRSYNVMFAADGGGIEAEYAKVDEYDSVELFIEKTLLKEQAVKFHYMKPFEIISRICSKSIRHTQNDKSQDVPQANFLFFENKRGYQFVSLDTLKEYKQYPDAIATIRYGSAAQNNTPLERTTFEDRILQYEIQSCFNTIKNIQNGMYSSQLMTYDMMTGQINYTNYDMIDGFKKEVTLEEYPLINTDKEGMNDGYTQNYTAKRMLIASSPSPHIDHITTTETARNNYSNLVNGAAMYMQSRMSQLLRLSDFRILFRMAGNSRHKVGDLINIDLRKTEFNKDNREVANPNVEEQSKYFSGLYMITSIKHTLTHLTYEMSIEAAKDSTKTKIGKI